MVVGLDGLTVNGLRARIRAGGIRIDGRPIREYSTEKSPERGQSLVHHHPDHAKRMTLINPCFEVDVAK